MSFKATKYFRGLVLAMAGRALESGRWEASGHVRKFHGHWSGEDIDLGIAGKPYEVIELENNVLCTVGITLLWNLLIGAGGTVYSNANAYIGVGDGNGSVPTGAAGDTDLTASSNKLRKAMDATFPSVSTNTISFRSTFGTSDANFAWNEWAVFNASSSGTILNHKGQGLGTKVNTASWQFLVQISIS